MPTFFFCGKILLFQTFSKNCGKFNDILKKDHQFLILSSKSKINKFLDFYIWFKYVARKKNVRIFSFHIFNSQNWLS
jgi:hypothetical protein